MLPADIHMHTLASHGLNTIDEMYVEAVRRGILILGFSEHGPRPKEYKYPVEYCDKLLVTFPKYIEQVQQIIKTGENASCKVLLGVELDWLPRDVQFMHQIIESYDFDYVIGGIHFLGTWGFDFTSDDWSKLTIEQCYKYFQ